MANERVSRSDLQEFHEEQMLHNENNDHNTLKIVKAFGGIDNLLDRLLKHKSIHIAQNELNCIHKIITNEPQSIESNQNENTQNSEQSVIILDKNNTYLNSYFEQIIANKILNILHHKITILLAVIMFIIWIGWSFIYIINVWWCTYAILFPTYCIIYFSFYALSINKNAFAKIIKTMDFWIQAYYLIVVMVNTTWYSLEMHVDTEIKIIYIVAVLLFSIAALIAVLIIVSLDGFHGHRKLKIFLSGLFGIIFIFRSIFWQFDSYSNGDDSIVYIYNDIGFSRIAQLSNGWQIIGIFMIKQCVCTYYFKDKAAVMVTRPFLIWINQKSNIAKLSENLSKDLNNKSYQIIEITTKNEKDNMSAKQIEQNKIASIKSQNKVNEESISSNKNIDYSNEC